MANHIPAPIWVDQSSLLAEVAHKFLRQPSISVDTESNSLHAYRERVCLIQFSIPDADFLVDPLAIEDLSPLADVFDSPKVEKIFHAAEYDILCLKRDFGFTFQNLFDTMIAARILGCHEIGLNNLLQANFGIELDKRFQKADWGKRPLPEDYRCYAQMDTHFLKHLRDTLYPRLKKEHLLPLASEDFARMTRLVHTPPTPIEEQMWHVTGARDLTSRQASILLELLKWRENKACELDRPPFKVIGNDELIEIAFTQPGSVAILKTRAHISERLADRYGPELIHAVEVGQKHPPLRCPASTRPDGAYRNRLDRLKEFRKQAAIEMKVESDIILPRDLLYQLAEQPPADWSEFEERMQLFPWRLRHYGEQIFSAIQSRVKEERLS
jgi:ribonuclease D